MIALEVLKQTTPEELARAATALCEEGYLATVSQWNTRFISGRMYGGKEAYDVTLSRNRVYCSCPASRFQRSRCKHTIMFALSCLRAMQEPTVAADALTLPPPNLTLARVLPEFYARSATY